MIVFHAEYNILLHPFHILGVDGVFGDSLFSAMHSSLVTSTKIQTKALLLYSRKKPRTKRSDLYPEIQAPIDQRSRSEQKVELHPNNRKELSTWVLSVFGTTYADLKVSQIGGSSLSTRHAITATNTLSTSADHTEEASGVREIKTKPRRNGSYFTPSFQGGSHSYQKILLLSTAVEGYALPFPTNKDLRLFTNELGKPTERFDSDFVESCLADASNQAFIATCYVFSPIASRLLAR
ncbi:hypothetical protein M9H77_27043 [Catharanthus roseus]|uniref:Uncharacterized protein n=1 Tax=Catharanthus roseus TaxID=4058 RepID=A0ACC0AD95_CATRO|nr:hypothetical protein M9H77_27043 [Catharanthus roseus]